MGTLSIRGARASLITEMIVAGTLSGFALGTTATQQAPGERAVVGTSGAVGFFAPGADELWEEVR